MKISATFQPQKWEEVTLHQLSDVQKITRASVVYAYTGELEGTGSVEYVMYYSRYNDQDPHDASAEYLGFLHFSGIVNGKRGSFIMIDEGNYSGGQATSRVRILENSGTEELAGISGSGTYRATQIEQAIELSLNL